MNVLSVDPAVGETPDPIPFAVRPADFDQIWPGVADLRASEGRHLRAAMDWADLRAIFALRFRRYVVEQGKAYPAQAGGLLIDPIDARSVNLLHCGRTDLDMAVRLSWADDVSPDDYLADLIARTGQQGIRNTVLCSRFVRAQRQLNIKALYSLFRLAYDVGLRSGARQSVLSTAPALASLFARFGYVPAGESFMHAISGPQVAMVLELRNRGHLERVHSPLVPILERFEIEVGFGATSRSAPPNAPNLPL